MELLLIAPSKNCFLPTVPGFSGGNYSLTDSLENDIKGIKNSNADLIIIPVEQSTSYLESKLLGGLELLVWLRITGINAHTILTSFYSLQEILQKTKLGFILGSKGISFHQIPVSTTTNYYEKLVVDKATKENLKSYLIAMFDNIQFRHAYANIWGLKRLVDIHNEVFYKNPFTRNLEINDTVRSLNYNIGKFLFQSKDAKTDYATKADIIRFLSYLKNFENLNILYIDDKADQGWLAFLKFLFKDTVNIFTLNLGTKENNSLYQQFETLNIRKPIDFIISDLRLYPAEDNGTDYDDFISIKLMKLIFDKKENGRLKYSKLKYMLFTASNQLLNYKTVIGSNKYTPSALFIKEGFDIQNTANQKSLNFLNLLKSLNKIAKERYRNIGAAVEDFDEEEEKRIDNFLLKLKNCSWQNEITQINKVFESFTHIILDTNLYFEDEPLLLLTNNDKIVLTYPVFKELERIGGERESSLRVYLSNYFIPIDNISVNKDGLTEGDIRTIDSKFQSGANLADLADGYFEQIISYISEQPNSKILFLTNDITIKNNREAPYYQIENWIRTNNISNVVVHTFFDKKFGKMKFDYKFQKTVAVNEIPGFETNVISNTVDKVKWKDCKLNERDYTLSFYRGGKSEKIRIGKKHIPGFKKAFNLLAKTDEIIELKENNDGVYSVSQISEILRKFK